MQEKAHAKYSASGSSRWLNCPASINMSEGIPPEPPGAAALEGTKAHACLEDFFALYRKGKTILSSRKALSKKYGDAEMVDHAMHAFEHVTLSLPKGAELIVEETVNADWFTTKGQFGTVDIAVVSEFDRLSVIDFKYGRGVVEAKDNSQLIYYALGISAKFDHNFSEVETKIIQPRAIHSSGEIRSHVYPIEELLAWAPRFRDAVKRAESGKEKPNAGEWCRYCPARIKCPEISDKKLGEAGLDFDAIPSIDTTKSPAFPPDKLNQILNAIPYVEHYIDAVKSYAKGYLKGGGRLPDWKLAKSEGRRAWKKGAEKDAKKAFGVEAFEPAKLLSPNKLEKALAADYDKKQIRAWIDKRTERPVGGFTLVKATDERKAVNAIDADFSVIAED